ncbi:MAG: ADP-forming succinate--CoA ligase subunit beta [Puniceicoccales bacterium]|nr:ADP-forming succinate--CoA ligase subunit beta [Puniceicoccales bacterium]
MKIHEFQTKELLARHGIPVDICVVIHRRDDAGALISSLDHQGSYVVKAQIHGGGRGKGHFASGIGGGVQTVHSQAAAVELSQSMLGNRLVTMQTGPNGCLVHRVCVGPKANFCRELYVSIFMDRAAGMPVIMTSCSGGIEIEELPENVLREYVCPLAGLQPFQMRKLAIPMGFKSAATCESFMAILQNLCHLFDETDASLIEINPLVETVDGRLLAIDGKAIFDDNALFRHSEISALRDPLAEDFLEVQASVHGVNYVSLDGDIGCLTNGAGLAMATMDLLHANGLEAANFLDLGDNSGEEAVRAALGILLRTNDLQCLLINTFGGAMCGDMVAQCTLNVFAEKGIKLPLVVRMEGARAAEGLALLHSHVNPRLFVAENLRDIPRKIRKAMRAQ